MRGSRVSRTPSSFPSPISLAIGFTAAALALTGCALWSGEEPVVLSSLDPGTSDDVASGAAAAHRELVGRDPYPSAQECRTCHEDHYREWSVSPHAYAQLSPVFNAMHATIVERTNGTFGDFCIRCHTPVGISMGEPIVSANEDRHPVSLEGVTCIVCHRIEDAFGKNSGRLPVGQGDVFAPVFGPRDDAELRRVIENPDEFGVTVTEPGGVGRRIHGEARELPAMGRSGFCGSCHDVTFVNGFRLEEAFSEYKQSPAAGRGESCQDCHMGTTPGRADGYATAPAAVVGGVPTAPRKRTNHMFIGPDHSIVHPGLFPHHPDAKEFATIAEWCQFDVDAGWGTDEFEDEVDDDSVFPERWESMDDRYDARDIIEEQLELLAEADAARVALLREGYVLGDVEARRAGLRSGLKLDVTVENGTDGHSVPTGFIAERMVFLQVTVTAPDGTVVLRSGDLDPNGDVRDLHSLYVRAGELPLDTQLFSLQSKFITRNQRGGEREEVLAVNTSLDPLPFARPDTSPSILRGRNLGARIHKQGIEPGGSRTASYAVPARDLRGAGTYRANVKLIAGMVPPNLIDAIQGVGFDYGMSPRAVGDAVVAGQRVLWERDLDVEVE